MAAKDSLTAKAHRFCYEYVIDLNGTQAAIRAGYAAGSAAVEANRLLRNAKIRAEISRLQADIAARTGVTVDRIVNEYATVAFGRLDEVAPWDESGPHLIPSEQLAPEKRALVATIKVKRERQWRGHGEDAEPWEVETLEIKPWDKLAALEKLGKHLGMFADKVEHSGPGGGPIEVEAWDLSKLTAEELMQLRALRERASS